MLAGVAQAAPFGFVDYPTAMQDANAYLPCKWVSTDRPEYAYLCKGGVWATATLQLQREGTALTEVNLQWRNWDPEVHPAGGEAQTAAHFLAHVLHFFVPQSLTAEVRNQFFADQDRVWNEHQMVHIDYDHTYRNGYKLHSLTITGKGSGQPALPPRLVAPQPAPDEPQQRQAPQPAPRPQEDITPQPVAPVQPPAEVPQQPKRQMERPAQAVPSRELPEYKANVRMREEAIEINGLSAGRRLLQVQNVDQAGPLVTEELRQQKHQIYNVLPSVKPDAYQQAEDLVRDAQEDTLPTFQLDPDQVAPLVAPDEGL